MRRSPVAVSTVTGPSRGQHAADLAAACSTRVTAGTPASPVCNEALLASAPVTARLLTELSAPALGSALGPASVLVLPVGSIEQHGSHLPVSTDLVTAAGRLHTITVRENDGGFADLILTGPAAFPDDADAAALGAVLTRAAV